MLQRIHYSLEGIIKDFWSFGTTLRGDIEVRKCMSKSILPKYIWNPTIVNIIRWLAGSLGRTTHLPSVLMFQALFKTFYFCKIIKKKLKRLLQRILLEIMKEIILGTSDDSKTCIEILNTDLNSKLRLEF